MAKYHQALFDTSCGEFWQSAAVWISYDSGPRWTTSIMLPLSKAEVNLIVIRPSVQSAATDGGRHWLSMTNCFVVWLFGGGSYRQDMSCGKPTTAFSLGFTGVVGTPAWSSSIDVPVEDASEFATAPALLADRRRGSEGRDSVGGDRDALAAAGRVSGGSLGSGTRPPADARRTGAPTLADPARLGRAPFPDRGAARVLAAGPKSNVKASPPLREFTFCIR
mmetsp:Transcript_11562/g.35941  ORF Transcript_11562/g.35941 Transcript_11562/m.35941 type:complete len:221 (+) Transcript_11562:211-873(+)